jgi:hypothetical protein
VTENHLVERQEEISGLQAVQDLGGFGRVEENCAKDGPLRFFAMRQRRERRILVFARFWVHKFHFQCTPQIRRLKTVEIMVEDLSSDAVKLEATSDSFRRLFA